MSPTGTDLLFFGQATTMFEHCTNCSEPNTSALPPHQLRLQDEKQNTGTRITKLDEFIHRNALLCHLRSDGQARMRRQLDVMREQSVIRDERISKL